MTKSSETKEPAVVHQQLLPYQAVPRHKDIGDLTAAEVFARFLQHGVGGKLANNEMPIFALVSS
jgi:hypothetical protein